MGFFGGSMVAYGLIPSYVTLLAEFSVYLLLLYAIVIRVKHQEPFQFHLLWVWLLFILVALCSIIVNRYINIRPIFSFRLILRFYILYLALINLRLDHSQINKINKFLFALFLIQLPVVAYKFSIYGVHERTIGTYGLRGGGLTTMIPIMAVAYLTAWYVLYKKSIWYLILSACFILWGIVGAKAALFFLFPLTFLGLYYLLIIKNKGFNIIRDVTLVTMVLTFSISVAAIFLYAQPRLNPDREVGGKIDFRYAFSFADNYSTGMRPNDPRFGGGRTATTKLAFKQLCEDGFANFVFGYGPGAMTPSVLNKAGGYDPRVWRIAGSYGITGLVYIWIEYGLFGVILICTLFVCFFWRNWEWYQSAEDPYWKAFAAGSIVFCILNLFIFITYNILPIGGDTLLPVFYYAMAVMHICYLQGHKKINAKRDVSI